MFCAVADMTLFMPIQNFVTLNFVKTDEKKTEKGSFSINVTKSCHKDWGEGFWVFFIH